MATNNLTDALILEQFVLPSRIERLRSVASKRTEALTVVLDHMHHDHNISAVVRSADAFGLGTVHLVGGTVQFSKTISIGSERWVDARIHQDPSSAIAALRNEGYKLVVLQAAEKSRGKPTYPVFDLPFTEKLALVFGNEKDGVTEEFLAAADISSHIPMFGFAESLNVSVAVAITLFCSTICGARRERAVETISHQAQEALVSEWLRKDVRAAEQILERLRNTHPEDRE